MPQWHAGAIARALCTLLIAFQITGCSNLSFPDSQRWQQAASDSFRDPKTFVPLIASAILAVEDYDEQLLRKAVKDKPVFGDSEDPGDRSDDGLLFMQVMAMGTALLGENDRQTGNTYWNRSWISATSQLSAGLVADVLKNTTDRKRPDNSNFKSFPSGHSTQAFAAAAVAQRNLKNTSLSKNALLWTDVGLTSVASLTAWARVEANRHWPTDVFFGAALGNFIAGTIYQAMLGSDSNLSFWLEPADDQGWQLAVQVNF